MPIFTCNDTTISYEIIGSGMPVIMLHGWGINSKTMSGCMEPVFSQINHQFKRIYLDLPGMGVNSHAGADIKNSDDMIRILSAFINSILPEKESIMVVGMSYGGYLARGIVKEMFDRVSGMILLCPLVIPGYRTGRVVPLQVMEKDDEFLSTLSENDRASFESINVILTKDVWERYCRDVSCTFKEMDTHFLNGVLDGSCTYDVDKLKEPFTKPCLIVTGKQDTEVGYLDQFELMKKYPNSSYVTINRAGHCIQIEQPDMFSEIIKAWLNDNINYLNS